ncbi:MAG: glycosyltransferase family 2 protein [Solirubrobacteraceae bacterium]
MALFLACAYDEEANVGRLIADIESRPELWRDGGRLVLVDDGSRDRTAQIAEAHTGPLAVEVLRLGHNQGPGAAFDHGFRHVLAQPGGDGLIVTLEADTTSDLESLPEMLAKAAHADVVLASVHGGGAMVGVGRFRQALSHAASSVVRAGAGIDAHTVSSFFRVYRAEILRAAYREHGEHLIQEHGFACKAEILAKLTALGAVVDEVPVTLDGSLRQGDSKLRILPTMAGYARMLARQRRKRPAAMRGMTLGDGVAALLSVWRRP